jgi:hypothetical protein
VRVVVPILAGDVDVPNEGHLPFLNLASITENTTANLAPDFFDGAQPSKVDKIVREELGAIIVPTKHANVPMAPNFLLEAKGPGELVTWPGSRQFSMEALKLASCIPYRII